MVAQSGIVGCFQLASDVMTKSNTGTPVKQLACVGGCQGDLRMLQCENKGMDDTGEISWKCLGPVPKGCKFGKIQVGSCGLPFSSADRLSPSQWNVPINTARVPAE